MCVVDFSCSACFLLLYYVLVLILWLSFDWIRRSGGVFTRVYVSKVCICAYMCVFRVLLPLLCVSLVRFVLYSIWLHFASMDDYSHSVWTRFLQLVVFVCDFLGMCFFWRFFVVLLSFLDFSCLFSFLFSCFGVCVSFVAALVVVFFCFIFK